MSQNCIEPLVTFRNDRFYYRVKDVTATYTKARGKHGQKETSTDGHELLFGQNMRLLSRDLSL